MRDEIDATFWAEHHAAFADTIDRGFAAIGKLFGLLHPPRTSGRSGPREA